MTQDFQNRKHRSEYHVSLTFDGSDGQHLPGQSINISLSGLLIKTETQKPLGTHCTVFIHLGSQDMGIDLSLDAEVVRHTDGGMALQFQNISPENEEHLQKIVLYNSENPEAVLEEINNVERT